MLPTPEQKSEIARLIKIRPAVADDLPFVHHEWKKTAYKHLDTALYKSDQGHQPPWAVWKTLFPPIVEHLCARSEVYIACPLDAPRQILAFAVTERLPDGTLVLHWVHTKKKFWRHGIAELLLRDRGFTSEGHAVFTFTSIAYSIIKERVKAWDYVPFWLFAFGKQG